MLTAKPSTDREQKSLQRQFDLALFVSKFDAMFPTFLPEIDDAERNRLEPEMDEYHPKSTRTLFVGNLEKVSLSFIHSEVLIIHWISVTSSRKQAKADEKKVKPL